MANVSWLFAESIWRLGLGFVIAVWLARSMGPGEFGFYTYVYALVGLFAVLCSAGIDKAVVRDLTLAPWQRDSILGSAFGVRLLGGVVAALAAPLVALHLRPEDEVVPVLVAIAASGFMFRAFEVIDLWYQSRIEAKYSAVARSTSFSVAAVIKIVLLINAASIEAFVLAGLLEVVLLALILYFSYRAAGLQLTTWRFDWSRARALLRESWPIALSSIAISIYMKIDQVMLAEMIGARAVGLYGAATRLSELWYFIPVAVMTTLAPVLVAAKQRGPAAYQEQLRSIFYLMSGLSLLVAIPVSLLSGICTKLIFGPEYADAGAILAVHIWAAPFVFLGVAQSSWSVNERLGNLYFYRTTAGAVANVGLNWLLIPLYEGLGAAVATVASYGVAAFIGNAFDARTRGIFWLQAESLVFGRYLIRWL